MKFAQTHWGICSFEAKETVRIWNKVAVTGRVPRLQYTCFDGPFGAGSGHYDATGDHPGEGRLSRQYADGIQILPIPADDVIRLQYSKVFQGANHSLINLFGQTVLTSTLQVGSVSDFNVKSIPDGTYQLVIPLEKEIVTKKIIIIHR